MALDVTAMTGESTGGVNSSDSLGTGGVNSSASVTSGGGGSPASGGCGSSTEPVVSDLSDSSAENDLLRKVIFILVIYLLHDKPNRTRA